MSNWFDEFVIREKMEMKRREYISTSDEYIKWLVSFSKLHPNFSDDSWDYSKNELDGVSLERVRALSSFYSVVDNYAKENYIYSIDTDFGCFYRVMYKNKKYAIGVMSGQGTKFYCTVINDVDDKLCINFQDILDGKKHSNVDFINEKLSELSDFIKSLYNSGVPSQAIANEIEKILNEVNKTEEKESKLTLK